MGGRSASVRKTGSTQGLKKAPAHHSARRALELGDESSRMVSLKLQWTPGLSDCFPIILPTEFK